MSDDLAPAIQAFRAGRADESARLCRQALVWNPGHPTAWNLLAILKHQGGQEDAAAPPLLRAVRLLPLTAEAFLVNFLVVCRNPVDVLAACRHFLVLQPASSPALERLAVLAQGDGDLESAWASMRRAARVEPRHAQHALNLALLLQGAGWLEDATTAVRTLLILEPGHGMGLTVLGSLHLNLGAPDQALPWMRRAGWVEPTRASPKQAEERIGLIGGASAPDGLFVRGPLTPVSGYGHMTCRFLERLVGRPGHPVQAVGVFGSERWPGAEAPVRARVALHCLIPPAVDPLPGSRTVVFSMFEGTSIPPAWARFSARHDLVVVPCEASRQAWMARGHPEERLRICPLGVDPAPVIGAPLALTDRRGRPVSGYRRRILNVSDFIPRKNVDGLLRVWLRATRADDDAVLIVKLGKGSPESRAAIDALFARTEQAVGRRWDEAAAVAVVDRRLTEEEMDGLFHAATTYCSLSHGEGWDLPLTKAGALGMGLIAPRHSAYVDYLDDSVARLIPARIEAACLPYSAAPWPPFHGLDWWTPDEEAAAAAIIDVVRGGLALPDARARLLGRFTWEQATDQLNAILAEVAGL